MTTYFIHHAVTSGRDSVLPTACVLRRFWVFFRGHHEAIGVGLGVGHHASPNAKSSTKLRGTGTYQQLIACCSCRHCRSEVHFLESYVKRQSNYNYNTLERIMDSGVHHLFLEEKKASTSLNCRGRWWARLIPLALVRHAWWAHVSKIVAP